MGNDVLRQEKGGYNKASVLAKLDAYNILLMMAEEGVSSSKLIPELEKARALPLDRVKSGFFGQYGFSTEDTDNYIADLEEKIAAAMAAAR